MGQVFYYEMRQKFITECVSFFIAKYDSFITNATIFKPNSKNKESSTI